MDTYRETITHKVGLPTWDESTCLVYIGFQRNETKSKFETKKSNIWTHSLSPKYIPMTIRWVLRHKAKYYMQYQNG